MSLPYFYEPDVSSITSTFILSEETSKHCIQVLRMKQGEYLQLTNGKGTLLKAFITKADKKNCEVKIESAEQHEPIKKNISIGISLLKNASRFEWFLEKATEIGISNIIPLLCNRTERQHFRFDRMQSIIASAMLQSQQTWLPVLQEPTSIDVVIKNSSYQQKLIAHCEEDEKNELSKLLVDTNVQILIGPEGDFSPQEIELALQQHFTPVSLGNTRLRSETAAMVAAALLTNA
jgi:16S rRNA (uracil1498-N3)-methyltransferase